MKVKVGMKITVGFLAINLLLVILGVSSYRALNRVDDSYRELIDRRVEILANSSEIRFHAANQVSLLRGALLDASEAENIDKIKVESKQIQDLVAETQKLVKSEEHRAILDEVENANAAYLKGVIAAVNRYGLKTDESRQKVEEVAMTDIIPIGLTIRDEIGTIADDQKVVLASESKDNSEQVDNEIIKIIIVSVISILVALGVSAVVSRMISRPMNRLKEAANRIAEGDLTGEDVVVKTRDEIADLSHSFNAMTKSLRGVIDKVGDNTDVVASASEELMASAEESSRTISQVADSMQNVAGAVDKQVELVEETSRTVTDMAEGIQHISHHAKEVETSTEQTAEKAKAGRETITQAGHQMNKINETFDDLAHVITRLGEGSKEIGHIIEVITAIANETNLLSLNAAIEAARAGEQGRGFAVVADEVRKLAEQSAQSAKQIGSLISSIQHETDQAVQNMNMAKTEVSGGIQAVQTAGQSFEDIHGAIEQVKEQIMDVSAAVMNMSQGAQTIVQAMDHLNEVSEETSLETQSVTAATEEQMASMEEISQSVFTLTELAQDLKTTVDSFKR